MQDQKSELCGGLYNRIIGYRINILLREAQCNWF